VQALPSLQVTPLALAGLEQTPVEGLQVPASWHWSEAVQVTVVPPVQTPLRHVSPDVQALPSLHEVPSALLERVQPPVAGLQVDTLHWSVVVHAVEVPEQVPVEEHTSPEVQALLSSQALPGLMVFTQEEPEHVSVVHWLLSSHAMRVSLVEQLLS